MNTSAPSARYTLAPASAKPQILDEFCATTDYHRKYAIALLNNPPAAHPKSWHTGIEPRLLDGDQGRPGGDLGGRRVSVVRPPRGLPARVVAVGPAALCFLPHHRAAIAEVTSPDDGPPLANPWAEVKRLQNKAEIWRLEGPQ